MTVLGDSLARGWGAREPQHTLAARIYGFIRKTHPGSTLSNFGTPGATSEEIAKSQTPHLRRSPCSIVIVVAGANDVQKFYTPARFAASYSTLLRKIRMRDPYCGLLVMGLPDVALSRRIPWMVKPAIAWLSKADNHSIARAARRYRAVIVPLYRLSVNEAARRNALLSADGMHPNDRGYAVMASATYPFVRTLLH